MAEEEPQVTVAKLEVAKEFVLRREGTGRLEEAFDRVYKAISKTMQEAEWETWDREQEARASRDMTRR